MSAEGILQKGGSSRDQYGTFNNAQPKEGDERPKTGCYAAYTTPPSHGWNPLWYVTTIRGSEWFHLYLWMSKDLAWAMDWFWFGMISGAAALLWSIFLFVMSVVKKNYVESWHYVAQFLWLAANYYWMWGELHDSQYPHDEKLYPATTIVCGYVLLAAICWLGIYYLALKHLKALPAAPKESQADYDDSGIQPHPLLSGMFKTWREYENIHILFWLAKDCAWNHSWPVLWWFFAVLTVGIALNFSITTSFYRGMAVNHAHYKAQFLWVLANLIWAYGEIFTPKYDEALPLLPASEDSFRTMRWYSAWVLVASFVVIVVITTAWIIMTIIGHTEEAKASRKEVGEGEPSSGSV